MNLSFCSLSQTLKLSLSISYTCTAYYDFFYQLFCVCLTYQKQTECYYVFLMHRVACKSSMFCFHQHFVPHSEILQFFIPTFYSSEQTSVFSNYFTSFLLICSFICEKNITLIESIYLDYNKKKSGDSAAI